MSDVPMLSVWNPPAPTGQPWNNPNVWNVPGTDPKGPTGQPKVSSQNWCWANISNQGKAAATNVSVQFYYCTPNGAVGQWSDFVGNSAGQVTLPTLAAGAVQHVCATTPWTPPNTGHVCLIAYVEASNDPGPPQTPTLAPQISDRHVAQMNMTAVTVAAGATLDHEFLAHSDEGAVLTVEAADPAAWHESGAMERIAPPAPGGAVQPVSFGLVDPRPAAADRAAGEPEPATRMEVRGSRILSLRARIPEDAKSGEQVLFTIHSTRGGETLSGLSVLATVA